MYMNSYYVELAHTGTANIRSKYVNRRYRTESAAFSIYYTNMRIAIIYNTACTKYI